MLKILEIFKRKQIIEDQKKIIADLEERLRELRVLDGISRQQAIIHAHLNEALEAHLKRTEEAAQIAQVTIAHLVSDAEIDDPAVLLHTSHVLQEINKLMGIPNADIQDSE